MPRKTLANAWDAMVAKSGVLTNVDENGVAVARAFYYCGAAAFREIALDASEMEPHESRVYRKAIDDELKTYLHREIYRLEMEEAEADGQRKDGKRAEA